MFIYRNGFSHAALRKAKCQRCLLIMAMLLFVNSYSGNAQPAMGKERAAAYKAHLHDSLFSTYYHQRVTHFRSLPQTKGDALFVGNSITDGGEWSELFNEPRIRNRGISGDVTAGVLYRLDEIINRKPAKVFLMIGTNDLARRVSGDSVVKNIARIVSLLRDQSPATQVYVQSILPVNDFFGKFTGHTSRVKEIQWVNRQLQQKSVANGYAYIDFYPSFCDKGGKLNLKYTNDGLHLNGQGYLLWTHLLYPYVFDAGTKPSLLPQPQQLQWKAHYFPLKGLKTIVAKDIALRRAAGNLQNLLLEKGIQVDIQPVALHSTRTHIELKLGKVAAPLNPQEAYRLQVDSSKIILTANTLHGIHNGLQTLRQLFRDGVLVDGCDIVDWPSFSWRGYMVDVGRNYQSLDLLKQQIEVMSYYKLNIFHFHLTEDIAWRLAVNRYPQLTAPENMLRDKGLYYTEENLKELIAFCKERYITLVPEIDMPGHSAAFTRAMGVDMQSDSGLAIVKNIIREFSATYDVPILHIGGDEVKITNKRFLPEVIDLVHRLGKQTVGWSPGGNIDNKTIRQLWMSDLGEKDSTNLVFIDSRHLYLNHMDPMETVTTIFHRQLGGRAREDKNMKGATLCLWHDRRVAREDDVLRMNAVYPGMLTFAERSWQGGGAPQWITNTPLDSGKEPFRLFEQRLLDQQRQYLSDLPFPYAKQSDLSWKLWGPFDNEGDLERVFAPESNQSVLKVPQASVQAIGGTVVLRHWWHPLVQGVLNDPKENTTWYASTRIWSAEEGERDFWVGFNNLSRSPATDSPLSGTWNDHKSRLWVNGQEVHPPIWQRGGQQGHTEIPLIDEGYEYRKPTRIALKKGWNTVLVKLPVGSFKGKDWQNPVKWMFTFIPVNAAGLSTTMQ